MHEALIVRAGDVRDGIDAQFNLYAAPSSLPEPADDLLNSRPPPVVMAGAVTACLHS